MNSGPDATRRWWKEPWPWIIAGLIGAALAASIHLIALSRHVADSAVPVAADSGAMAREVVRAHAARALGLHGTLRAVGDRLSVELQPAPNDAKIELRLRHPFSAAQDIRIELQRETPGKYVGNSATVAVRYAVTLDGTQWRLTGSWKPGAVAELEPGV